MKTLRILFLAALCSLLAPAWCLAAQPGGQGRIENDVTNACFKTASKTITEVCARYHVNWKMWTLMGEPVSNYTLTWRLSNITLQNPQQGQSMSYSQDNLPNELKKAAGAIELYIDAVSIVNDQALYHHFNTGVSVRAGSASSYNTPGSSHWDNIFSHSNSDLLCAKHAKSNPVFIDAQATKALFNQGIHLKGLLRCPESGVSELGTLESAIARLCAKPDADKTYVFCPKIPEAQKPKDNAVKDAPMSKQEGRPASSKNQAPKNPDKAVGADIDAAFSQLEADQAKAARAQQLAAEKNAKLAAQPEKNKTPSRHEDSAKSSKPGKITWSPLLRAGSDFEKNSRQLCQTMTIEGRSGWRTAELDELNQHFKGANIKLASKEIWPRIYSGLWSCAFGSDGGLISCSGPDLYAADNTEYAICVHE